MMDGGVLVVSFDVSLVELGSDVRCGRLWIIENINIILVDRVICGDMVWECEGCGI
jgi:hypothetical protein